MEGFLHLELKIQISGQGRIKKEGEFQGRDSNRDLDSRDFIGPFQFQTWNGLGWKRALKIIQSQGRDSNRDLDFRVFTTSDMEWFRLEETLKIIQFQAPIL